MRRSRIFILCLACFIASCDPMDERMVFYNNSAEAIFTRMIFIDKDITGTMVGLRALKADSKTKIGKLYSWETEFENSGDSILNVVIFKNYVFLNDKYEESDKIKSDSLLRIGDYKIRQYTYSQLESTNWEINYPDDGFEKGKPLRVTE